MLKEYWASPAIPPLTFLQKAGCYLRLIAFTIKILPKLLRDLIIAGEEVFWRFTDLFKGHPPDLQHADNLHHTTAL